MNELTNILAETAERLLADHVGRELLEAAEAGTFPEALWETLEENGLTQPLVPEDLGGIGATWADAFVIAYAAGRHRAPVPLVETMAAGWLLSAAGLDVPEGAISLVDGHALSESGGAVNGAATAAPWGAVAGHALAVLPDGTAWRAVLMGRDGADISEDRNVAREPRDSLAFSGAAPAASGKLPFEAGNDAVSPACLAGAAMRSAQMAGAMAQTIELAVEHATTRQQFGRPIAKFQALQQIMAEAAARTAEARMAAEVAFRALDGIGDAGNLALAEDTVASAKIVCGEAAERVTDVVHEVHGAIGFTEEHELHFLTRRLWSWRGEFGNAGTWAERLGLRVLGRGAANLWPDVTARL